MIGNELEFNRIAVNKIRRETLSAIRDSLNSDAFAVVYDQTMDSADKVQGIETHTDGARSGMFQDHRMNSGFLVANLTMIRGGCPCAWKKLSIARPCKGRTEVEATELEFVGIFGIELAGA